MDGDKGEEITSPYSVPILPGVWWLTDQQLFHVYMVLFSRLLSWVHASKPLGFSWWLQLSAAAWAAWAACYSQEHPLRNTAFAFGIFFFNKKKSQGWGEILDSYHLIRAAMTQEGCLISKFCWCWSLCKFITDKLRQMEIAQFNGRYCCYHASKVCSW